MSDSRERDAVPAARGSSGDGSGNGSGSGRPSDKLRLYVGGLDSSVTEADVRAHFTNYYPTTIEMKGGFAFVSFGAENDAEDAVKYLDRSALLGRNLTVRVAGERPPPPPQSHSRNTDRHGGGGPSASGRGVPYGYRVEIENLAPRTSWQDLKDFGRQAGNSVKYADVYQGPQGKCGVVSFGLEEDMRRAVSQLHEQTLDGNVVRVYEDKTNTGPRGVPTKTYGAPIAQAGGGGGGYPRRDDRRDYPPPMQARDAYYPERDRYEPRDRSDRDRYAYPSSRGGSDPYARRGRSPSPPPRRDAYERRRSRSRSPRGNYAAYASPPLPPVAAGPSSSSHRRGSSRSPPPSSRRYSPERERGYGHSGYAGAPVAAPAAAGYPAVPYDSRAGGTRDGRRSSRSRSPPPPPSRGYYDDRRR